MGWGEPHRPQHATDAERDFSTEWLTVGELDPAHLLAEHRAAVAEIERLRIELQLERAVSADLEQQLDDAFAVIDDHHLGHDVDIRSRRRAGGSAHLCTSRCTL